MAVRIGAARYDIIANTKGFDDGLKRFMAGTRKMGTGFQSVRQATQQADKHMQRLGQRMTELKKLYAAGEMSQKRYGKEMMGLVDREKRLSAAIQQRTALIKRLNAAYREGSAAGKAYAAAEAKSAAGRARFAKGARTTMPFFGAGGVVAQAASGRDPLRAGPMGPHRSGRQMLGAMAMGGLRGAGRMAGRGMRGAGRMVMNHPGVMAALSGYGLYRGLTGAFRTAADYERIERDLGVLSGSQLVGSEMFQLARDLDLKTTLNLSDVTRAQGQILQAGSSRIAAAEVTPMLTRLADISGGDANKFRLITKAFSDVLTKDKFMAQEKYQFANAGFNPLPELARVMGLQNTGQVLAEMEQGNVHAGHMIEAITLATEKGGRFFNRVNEGMDTLSGKAQMFGGAVEQLQAEIGKTIFGGPAGGGIGLATEATSGLAGMIAGFRNRLTAKTRMNLGGSKMPTPEEYEWFKANGTLDRVFGAEMAAQATRHYEGKKRENAARAEREQQREQAAKQKEQFDYFDFKLARGEPISLDKVRSSNLTTDQQIDLIHRSEVARIKGQNRAAAAARGQGVGPVIPDYILAERRQARAVDEQNALSAYAYAQQYYADERSRMMGVRDAVAAGPSTLVSGSREAMLADVRRRNQAWAEKNVKVPEEPTDEQLKEKALEWYKKENKRQEKEEARTEKIVNAIRESKVIARR